MATSYTRHLAQKPANNPAVSGKFIVSDQQRLERFLILGTEGGSYYASERKLTLSNVDAVKRLVASNNTGIEAVKTIVAVSDAGRAPKNDPALLALAVAVKFGTPLVRSEALAALPKVARIGTHLHHFLDYAKALKVGWGRSMKRAVGSWYTSRPADKLARQLVKYQSRDGWSNRDALRLAHPTPPTIEHQALFHWVVKGEGEGKAWAKGSAVEHVWAFEQLKKASTVQEAVELVQRYGLPREAVPTQFLNSPEIWRTLLPDMKPEATLRNLAKMTSVGILQPFSDELKTVVARLTDPEQLKAARLHPIKFLTALLTYKQGHGTKGNLTWTPIPTVTDAVEKGFYASFGYVEPTRKRTLKALDISSSMNGGEIAGVRGLTPRVGSALMSMVTARVEQPGDYHFMGFHHHLLPLQISPTMTLRAIVEYIDRLGFGSTDVSLPMVWAAQQKIPVDAFEIYTDSETNSHSVSPYIALKQYREKMGIDAKLVVVGMVANNVSVADPDDGGMLDVVGFDTAAPEVINDFIRG